MVQSINAISSLSHNPYNDPEYMRIVQELMKLGLSPTGNKAVDKGRLEAAKREIAEKIKDKFQEQMQQSGNVVDAQREQMEVQKLGAMNVAELNKLLHGLV